MWLHNVEVHRVRFINKGNIGLLFSGSQDSKKETIVFEFSPFVGSGCFSLCMRV
jgi:hypothetical protein